jgi:Outer membrane protein beta-barrel domain
VEKLRLLKILFYSFYFILFYCLASNAQIQLGVKAGYNRSNVPFSGDEHYTSKDLSAFNAGLMVSIPLSAHLILKPEAVYSVQGIIAINHATLGDQNIKYSDNYLNLPVLIEYRHATGLFVETGLQFGILLSANADDREEFHMNQTPYTQPGDLSWVFGLGYEIPKINLGLDVRYNLGLTNTSRYEGQFENNRVFQLGLFYFFKKL